MASKKVLYVVLIVALFSFIEKTDAISFKFWKWSAAAETTTESTDKSTTPVSIELDGTIRRENGKGPLESKPDTEIILDFPSFKPNLTGITELQKRKPVIFTQEPVLYTEDPSTSPHTHSSSPLGKPGNLINYQHPSHGIPSSQKPVSSDHSANHHHATIKFGSIPHLPIVQNYQKIPSNSSSSTQFTQDSALNELSQTSKLQTEQKILSNSDYEKNQKITWTVQSEGDSAPLQQEKLPITQTYNRVPFYPGSKISQKITWNVAPSQPEDSSTPLQNGKLPILQTDQHIPSNSNSDKNHKITWTSVQTKESSTPLQNGEFPILQNEQKILSNPDSKKNNKITWNVSSVQSEGSSVPLQQEKLPITQTHHRIPFYPSSEKSQKISWNVAPIQSVNDSNPKIQHGQLPIQQTHLQIPLKPNFVEPQEPIWSAAPVTQAGSVQQYTTSPNSAIDLEGHEWMEVEKGGKKVVSSTQRPLSTTDHSPSGQTGIKFRPDSATGELSSETIPADFRNKTIYSSDPIYSKGNEVTDEDLEKLFESLFIKDSNNAMNYITMNLQKKTTSGNSVDEAPEPFLIVEPEAFEIPTIQKVLTIYDNYHLDSTINESISSVEKKEEDLLIDTFLSTNVMAGAMRFLANKGYIKRDYWTYKEKLRQLWFTIYPRGSSEMGSSGFEHVFLTELLVGKGITGLHNWIYFNAEEINKRVNYLGYIKKADLGDRGAIIKIHARIHDIDKPVTTMLVGTSPELEMALYTVCFMVRADQKCPVSLGGTKINIITYKFQHHGIDVIKTAYPHI